MARYFEWTNTARASTVNALGKNSWYGEIMDLRRDLRDAFGGVAGDIDTILARLDSYELPVMQVFGTGMAGTHGLAAADHVHPMLSGTPRPVRGADNQQGIAGDPARYDHQHRLELAVMLSGGFIGQRPAINFIGSVQVMDNPLLDRLDITITGGGTGGSGVVQNFFDVADFPTDVSIGTIEAGRTVEKVVVEILTPFDSSVGLTVGEDVAQARLMAAADNRPGRAGEYMRESGYLCPTNTTFKLYFTGTAPTAGAGRVLIYHA